MSRHLRVLILSADVGESHAVMARTLATALARRPGVDVRLVGDFAALGPLLTALLYRPARMHTRRVRLPYHLAYCSYMRFPLVRRLGELVIYGLGRRPIQRLVDEWGPDVVVSTHPLMTMVLSGLRRQRRLGAETFAVVSSPSGADAWARPHIDHHLVFYPHLLPGVRRIARGGRVTLVRPLVPERFFAPASRAAARSALGLEREGAVIIVCGGGWGVGDLSGAVAAALEQRPAHVLVVTGRNPRQTSRMRDAFAGDERVRVLGFSERMSELLAAADVFVTASVGLSCLEARLLGCPVVCYGYPVAHVRDNMAALAACGAAASAYSRDELRRALAAALDATPPPALSNDARALPDVAGVILDGRSIAAEAAPASGIGHSAAGAGAGARLPARRRC